MRRVVSMPSSGSIRRSISTTSGVGRELFELRERLGAAGGDADDLEVGLGLEEGEQPAPHHGVVVDDQDADRVAGSVIAGPRYGHGDAHDRPPAGGAVDRQPPADLGRAAAHRVQAEVTGRGRRRRRSRGRCRRPRGRRSSAARLHAHVDRARARVLDRVGQGLARDAEQVGLRARRKAERRRPAPRAGRARPRARRSRPRAARAPATRPSPSGSRPSSEISARISLCAPRVRSAIAPSECAERGRLAARRVVERPLRAAGVQHRGEQRLGDRVVQVAGDPLALVGRALALAQLGGRQRGRGPRALADDGGEDQRRQGRDRGCRAGCRSCDGRSAAWRTGRRRRP